MRKQFNELNEYQYNAVINEDNVCVVSANVGSGKTTVLISKVLYLTQKYNIKDLIILTFTNKAAQEIKDRLFDNNKNLSSEDLDYCGTFHSVALTLLKTKLPISELGYTKDFSVIDPEEEADIAREIIFEKKLKIKYMNKLINRLEKDKQNYINNESPKYDDDIFILLDLLKEEKIRQNKMSFDDLISNTIELIKYNPINPKWIIVDEFQDSSSDQLGLIDSLKCDDTKLFVVGDENQIIYSWRNANKDVFNTFCQKYNATVLSLPINYRSTKSILEFAKSVIDKPVELIGTRDCENKIIIKNHYNEFNEAQYLCGRIKDIIKSGCEYKDIAILYRTQKQSNVLSDVFSNVGIPFEISIRKNLNSIPVLCWLISLLKCSVNTSDMLNLIKISTDVKYGINLTKSQVKKIVSENNTDYELINKIYNFNSEIEKFKTVFELYDYYNLDKYIRPTSSTFKYDKKLIMTLLDKINNFIIEQNISIKYGISEFINSSALYGINILNENINIEKNSVKLMTLHASKGLEFKNVFIIGANNGLIPLPTKDRSEYDEEKRLFFVGITRAKDNLEISYYTAPDSPRVFDEPSEFLRQIPDNLIESNDKSFLSNVKSLNDLTKQLNTGKVEIVDNLFEDNESKKKIKHPKYGIGEIINESDDVITVDFEKYGAKEFLKDLEIFEII